MPATPAQKPLKEINEKVARSLEGRALAGAVEAADGSAGDTTTTQRGEEGDYEMVPAAASEQLAQWQESHSARLKSLEQGFSESASEIFMPKSERS